MIFILQIFEGEEMERVVRSLMADPILVYLLKYFADVLSCLPPLEAYQQNYQIFSLSFQFSL